MSNDYYNDHYTSQVYVNRPRVVSPDNGEPYLAVSLSVKHGKKDDQGRPKFTQQLDTRVVGTQAKAMVEALIDSLESLPQGSDRPVISASIKAGDIEPGEPYTVKRGPNTGKVVTPLRGRLVKLTHVYVNGERFQEGLDGEEDEATTALPSEQVQLEEAAAVSDETQSSTPDETQTHATEVKLSDHDPELQVKMARLMERGFVLDVNAGVWKKPASAGAVAGAVGAAVMNAAIVFMPLHAFLS